MIRSFDELFERVKTGKPQVLSVAVAQDEAVLSAVWLAYQKQIIKGAYLVGDEPEIRWLAGKVGMDMDAFSVVNVQDKQEACAEAIKLVSQGKADLPMKGFVDTAVVLKELLNRDYGLRTGKLICHVALFDIPAYDKLLLLSDSAMTIAPDVEQKADIIRACTDVEYALENDNPKVAVLAAIEKVNPKMEATVDAEKLVKMNRDHEIAGCTVAGPLAFDLAISKEAAVHKKIDDPVAGDADVLIVPDIEAGNILNKSFEYFADGKKGGCIMGAAKPMVLVSRSSSDETKLRSIALAVLVSQQQ